MKKRHALLPALALIIAILSAPAPAQESPQPQLVADLNREPNYHSPAIRWVLPVETGVVFNMSSIGHGDELWFSDGTQAGTALVKDITPGPTGSFMNHSMQAGARVCFTTGTQSQDTKLWFTDGTEAGTTMVLDAAGLLGQGKAVWIQLLGEVDGGILFRVHSYHLSPDTGELWFSDGTVEGTREIALFEEGLGFSITFQQHEGLGYFLGGGNKLWRSDGTVDDTVFIVDPASFAPGGNLYDFEVADSRFYLSIGTDAGDELWTCSLQGTDPVLLRPASGDWIDDMKSWGDRLAFEVNDSSGKKELWASEGSSQGTVKLPVSAGEGQSFGFHAGFTEYQGALYFGVYSDATGSVLWRTDGTPEGTRRVPLPKKAGNFAWIEPPREAGGLLYLEMAKGSHRSLWTTDGTAKGTRPVNSGKGAVSFSDSFRLPAVWQDRLFFTSRQTGEVQTLWVTAAGGKGLTQLTVPQIAGTQSGLAGDPLVEMDGDVLGFVWTPTGRELWRINPEGAARAVWRDKHLQGGAFVATLEGKAFFAPVTVTETPSELWVTNGTGKGTRRLARYGPLHWVSDFVRAGDRLFFRVSNLGRPDFGMSPQLWVTDGTPKGTRQVTAWDFTRPGPVKGELVAFQGDVFFIAQETADTLALWRSDGTPDGTYRVKKIQPGYPRNDYERSLTVIGDRLSFTVKTVYYHQLWTSDGTEAGTTSYQNPSLPFMFGAIRRSVDLNGIQIFEAKRGANPRQWYRSEGTAESVQPLMAGLDYPVADHIGENGGVAIAGGLMFYRGRATADGNTDSELWVTDGSVGSPRLVKDIVPGPGSSAPYGFFAVGDIVYFIANTPEHGAGLWKSDGTEAGTVMVADLNPGPESFYPENLLVIGGKLYFTAHTAAFGREMYVLELE